VSIKARFINVIVRKGTLERLYPGGLAAYEREAPNRTLAVDDHLTCASFMDEESANALVAHLESYGLLCDVGGVFRDVAVVSRWGETLPCPWLQQGHGLYWLAGMDPGEIALTTGEKGETNDGASTRQVDNFDGPSP
jgi:hypothetical protein